MSISMNVFMPIRIRRHDKKYQETQLAGSQCIIVVESTVSTACYTGRKPAFRILCGLI